MRRVADADARLHVQRDGRLRHGSRDEGEAMLRGVRPRDGAQARERHDEPARALQAARRAHGLDGVGALRGARVPLPAAPERRRVYAMLCGAGVSPRLASPLLY